MLNLLASLLILVPSPQPIAVHPLVGGWEMNWNGVKQLCWFDEAGNYFCPKYQGLDWHTDESCDNLIWFKEWQGRANYGAVIDWRSMSGKGWYQGVPWEPHDESMEVRVNFVKIESLFMPKELPAGE